MWYEFSIAKLDGLDSLLISINSLFCFLIVELPLRLRRFCVNTLGFLNLSSVCIVLYRIHPIKYYVGPCYRMDALVQIWNCNAGGMNRKVASIR